MSDTTYSCPECKDRGFILSTDEHGYEYARPCKCRELKMAKERLERSGLAREFKTKTFENFDTCENPQLMDAKNTAMKFTEELKNKNTENLPSMTIIALLTGIVGGVIFVAGRKSVCFFIEKQADEISLFAGMMDLAVIVFLADMIKILLPVNLFILWILIFVVFVIARGFYQVSCNERSDEG
jgi:hypothetical protein